MSRARIASTALLLALLLAGCSDRALDTVIPTDRAEWPTKLTPVLQALDDKDRKLATAYIARHQPRVALPGMPGSASSAPGLRPGFTIGEAIKEQEAWVAEQARQKKR